MCDNLSRGTESGPRPDAGNTAAGTALRVLGFRKEQVNWRDHRKDKTGEGSIEEEGE